MNRMITTMAVGALTVGLAGCCCCEEGACGGGGDCKDPVIGNWSAKLPYDYMYAGSLIFSRDAEGKPEAVMLHRWGSPEKCRDVKVEGKSFSLVHPYGCRVEGTVEGCRMTARIAPWDVRKNAQKGEWKSFEGKRNPPIPEGVKTADAKFGEPIDLLKDGMDGWETMNPDAKRFGWVCEKGVLSNKIGLTKDGKWLGGGANLKTKRSDFLDFNLEYDVRVPKDSNSGVYLRGRYEIQVVDSYGKAPNRHNMAAYYGREVPAVAAEKPAGEWQHVSVTLYRQHLTVVLNGQVIHDNVPVVGVTGGAIDADMFAPGPIYLQGDHSDADFKNMILRPAL